MKTETPSLLETPIGFSLVLGGSIYQLFRRAHLAGDSLELLPIAPLLLTMMSLEDLLKKLFGTVF
ncbi:MAG: hypothetical protein ABI600_09050 [Luteolibacter sp.]